MAKCPACSTDITENSRFCFSCGQSVMPEAAFATKTVAGSSPQSTSQKRASRPSAASATSADDALFGKGGMGEVYRADDLTLGQQVALKFLPESLVDNPYSLTRFRNEVRIARQVSHPNVCRVYDVGEIDGHFYLSMEYVDGEDLASLLRRIGRLPAAAHEKGVLHRDAPDLVPTDVLIGSEAFVVLRWGLLSMALGMFVNTLLSRVPGSPHFHDWYFGNSIFMLASVVALAAWGFSTSMAGRRLWKMDLFD